MAVVTFTPTTIKKTRGSYSKLFIIITILPAMLASSRLATGPARRVITSISPGMLEFAAIDVHGAGPAEAPHQIADRPQDVQMQEDIKVEPVLGAGPGVPQKGGRKGLGLGINHDGQQHRHAKASHGVHLQGAGGR